LADPELIPLIDWIPLCIHVGASINGQPPSISFPLGAAADQGHLSTVKLLLMKGIAKTVSL
jgi:hypothetical protein